MAGINSATVCAHAGSTDEGMVVPLRNSMGIYRIWIRILASAMVLEIAARISPMPRSAHTPNDAMTTSEIQCCGNGMA